MKNLIKSRHVWKIIMALILVFNLFSVAATPVQASSACGNYHWVQYGDTLAKIGAWYGVYWPDIAAANGIGWPYTIYYGTKLCIPYGGSGSYDYYSSSTDGDFAAYVIDVNTNRNITLKAVNLPKKETLVVSIGKCNYANPTEVGTIKTGSDSGTFTDTFKIPNKYKGLSCLIAYLDSTKTARSTSVTFTNNASGSSSTAQDYNLDFRIHAVKRNKTVTLRVTDFVKGELYHIYVGKEGSGAYPYTYVGSFRRSNNQDFNIKVNIPSAYKGQSRLDVRIQGITVTGSVVKTFNNKNK